MYLHLYLIKKYIQAKIIDVWLPIVEKTEIHFDFTKEIPFEINTHKNNQILIQIAIFSEKYLLGEVQF